MDRDGPQMEEARPVRPEELDPTLALVNRVFRTGVDQDMSTDYPLVFDPGNLENLRVVAEGGHILSHAAMARRELRENGCVLPISMICAVATDPEHRRRGAASRIMEDATEAMAARGDAFGTAVDRTRQRLLPPPGLGGGGVQRLGLPGGTPIGRPVRAASARPRVSGRE